MFKSSFKCAPMQGVQCNVLTGGTKRVNVSKQLVSSSLCALGKVPAPDCASPLSQQALARFGSRSETCGSVPSFPSFCLLFPCCS